MTSKTNNLWGYSEKHNKINMKAFSLTWMGDYSHLPWSPFTMCLNKDMYTLLGGGHQHLWIVLNATQVKLGLMWLQYKPPRLLTLNSLSLWNGFFECNFLDVGCGIFKGKLWGENGIYP